MSERVWDKFLTERDRAVFAAGGFGARAGFGKRPALLIIDVNWAFCGERPEPILESIKRWRTSCGEDAWVALPYIRQLIDRAHAKGLPVIYTTGERWADIPPGPFGLPALYEHNPIPVSSALVSRAALHAAGGYGGAFPDFAEDWDLWLRFARRGLTLLSVPAARIRYRRQAGGMTADVAALAAAQIRLHRAHGDLVDAATRRRALARDRRALARDRVRRVVRRAL